MLRTIGLLATALAMCVTPTSAAGPNSTLLISRPSGVGALPIPGDGDSGVARNAISGDGRFVVFVSGADDLGVADLNSHAWVRDTIAETTRLVDRVPGSGAPGDGSVTGAAISRDGSTVCFVGNATNLVAGVTGFHLFVVTLSSGAMAVADRADGATGVLGNDQPDRCALDATGARVVFDSRATNLVGNDTNGVFDVFVRDLGAGTTTRLSVDSAGAQAPDGGSSPAINADGTRIAFVSHGALITADTNGFDDVYVRNTQADTLVRASEGTGSVQSNEDSSDPAIDDGGGHVAFASRASNLDPGADSNTSSDIYWRDFGTDSTVLVSRATGGAGAQSDGDCTNPAISGDGLGVAFEGDATNLGGGLPRRRLVYLRRLGTNLTFVLSSADGPAGEAADALAASVSLGTAPTVSTWMSIGSNLDADASGEFPQVFKRDLAGEATTALVSRPNGTGPRSAAVNFSVVGPRSVSADGRIVVFLSRADGIDAEAAGRLGHIFARDTVTGVTTLVSRGPGPAGAAADADSFNPVVNAGGTHVAFFSRATNLLPGVATPQIYVRDLATGDLEIASRADGVAGAPATALSGDRPGINADGRKVVFVASDGFDASDDNSRNDVYLRDLDAGTTTLVSGGAGGAAGNGFSGQPGLSDDGTRVSFRSNSANLLGGAPISGGSHAYVRDLAARTIVLADRRSTDGEPGSGNAFSVEISRSGNRVAFFVNEALTPEAISPGGALYVRDLASDSTILAGREDGPDGAAVASSFAYAINRDGTRVSFATRGAGLSNFGVTQQVFVRDLGAGTTTLASAADGTAATAGNANANGNALSAGGGCVVFDSQADNLTTPAYATRDFPQVYLRAVTGQCPEQSVTPPSGTPLAAKSVVLRPGKVLKLVAGGVDPLAADPTAGGGTLALTGTTGAASYELAASGWKKIGKRKLKGFEFKGAACRVSMLAKRIKAACKGDTGTLSLPEAGPVTIVLTVGAQDATFCAACGGRASGKPGRVFKRKGCGAPASCP